jgi:hypothetical protein
MNSDDDQRLGGRFVISHWRSAALAFDLAGVEAAEA